MKIACLVYQYGRSDGGVVMKDDEFGFRLSGLILFGIQLSVADI